MHIYLIPSPTVYFSHPTMSAFRIAALLAAVAAVTSAAPQQPQQPLDASDMIATADIPSDPAAAVDLHLGNTPPRLDIIDELVDELIEEIVDDGDDDGAGHKLHGIAARGSNYNYGGQYQQPKRYYSYTYCYKWRGSCHSPYKYDVDYAQHRCSLYENTYYKPCWQVCCDITSY